MKTKFFVAVVAAALMGTSGAFAQTVQRTTTTTVTSGDQKDPTMVGDQATMDTKSGKKARKAEKKLAKGKEHKALKKQDKANDKEAVGR